MHTRKKSRNSKLKEKTHLTTEKNCTSAFLEN